MIVSNFAIGHRATVFVLLFVIVIGGVESYLILPREAAPDITIPNILVHTFYEGVTPDDIESQITIPLERRLNEIGDIKELRSSSAEGVSLINIEFNPDIDIDVAMQKVRDKVDLAKPDLPGDLEDDPLLREINFSEFPIMIVVISGPLDLARLKLLADDLEEEIESIPGVLNADVVGGLEREITVEYEPERLAALQVSVTSLMQTVIENNVTTPGGSLDIGEGKYLVKIPGEFDSPTEADRLVVYSRDGQPLYLRDVASLNDGFEDRKTISRLNGEEAVSITVQKRSGENIIDISDRIKVLLRSAEPALPAGVGFSITLDQANDIRDVVSDLENSILSGLLLVLIVVFLSIGIRNALLVSISIPCSMLISFFAIRIMGMTLNMVVLFSLILAVGMLVDNAIVIIENVFRHGQEGKNKVQAAIDATAEVAWPVITSTLTTVGAFLPMVFWPGITGEFMRYLPITVIITLLSSLGVALVINPALASVFIRPKGKPPTIAPGFILRTYRWIIGWSVDNPGAVLLMSGAILVGVIAFYAQAGLGTEFFPETDPKRAFVDVRCPIGSALGTSDDYVRRVEHEMKKYDDIVYTVANVGSGGSNPLSQGTNSTHSSRVSIEFKKRQQREMNSTLVLAELRDDLTDLVGADIDIRKEDEGPPTGAAVSVEISGQDYTILAALRKQVMERIRPISGLVNLRDDYVDARPEIAIKVDKERAALFGMTTQLVAKNIQAAVRGIRAGVYRDGNDEYDILVRLPKSRRESLDALNSLNIATFSGLPVPLSSVASIELTSGFGSIERVSRRRVITVEADAEGRLPNDVLSDVKSTLAAIELPRGYYIDYAGQSKEQDEASAFLLRAFAGAIFLIAIVLVTQFNSVTRPAIVLSSVILSMIGVFLGLLILRTPFGIIMTGIGVISLAGVVVNNAIILIDYVIQLRDRGVEKRDSLIQAGLTRFRPVLLTAVTTILGLLPMAIGVSFDFRNVAWDVGSENSQWWGPMAIAVIFGLGVATILTLVVVPSMIAFQDRIGAFVHKAAAFFRQNPERAAEKV